MEKRFNRKLYVLFGAWTLLTIVAVAAIGFVFRYDTIRAQAEKDVAVTVHRILTSLLEREVGDLSDAKLASFSEEASRLLGDQIRAIRLWDSDGSLLAGTVGSSDVQPDLAALAQAAQGYVEAFQVSSPQGDSLVSYTPLAGGAILEVQQDYGLIGNFVISSRRLMLLSVTAGIIMLLLPVQGTLWAITHGLKREYERLLYLYRSGQAVRSTLDLTEVLGQVARDAALYTRAHLGFTTLVEEESADLIVTASFEREGNTTAQHHRKIEEWFVRRTAGTGETVTAQQDSLPSRSILGYELELQGPVFLLCVPILGRERVIGAVTVVRCGPRAGFKASEVQMVEEMAGQAAMAVEQAVLFAKMRSYASEVELSYDTTLKVLMAALDTKDAATHGHSERVSRLTVAVAKEMGVPKERMVDIERGALLHDVGKIGVPDVVLQKPASLNEREYEAMQKHPLLAGLMISNVGFLEGAMPILLYHHERFDGTGYPFGLKGEAIPLEARIFAVVDAYDAMTSDRPYRKALPPEAALLEIERNAGVQFDSIVVEAFTRVIDRMQPVLARAS